MDIDAWVFDRLTAMNKFIAWWKANHKENAEDFPNELLPGEWEEQFEFFNSPYGAY